MTFTNQKQNRKGCMTLIVLIIFLNILGYFVIKDTEKFLLEVYGGFICFELIILISSFAVFCVKRSEKSLFVALIMLSFDSILTLYIWWLSVAEEKVIEYVLMVLGLLIGGICGFILVSKKKKEKGQKPSSTPFIVICGVAGILFARVAGFFLNQNQIAILGELAIDTIMMTFSFAIGAGIARLKHMGE